MRSWAVAIILVALIAGGLGAVYYTSSGNPQTKATTTTSNSTHMNFSISSPRSGSTASVYGFGQGDVLVQGTSGLGAGNWLFDPSHAVDLTKPSGGTCVTDSSAAAPYMSILSATVSPRAAQIAPTYKLEQLEVDMYVSNFSSLSNHASTLGVTSFGWFFHFDFQGNNFYAGAYIVTNSSTQSSAAQSTAPAVITYWYGPWSNSRPTGETETNGTTILQSPGLSDIVVYFPAEAVRNVTEGDTLTNMGLLTFAGSGDSPDSGNYCTNDTFGGNTSYRLFDPLLPSGTIQVAAESSCLSSSSTAPLNWTRAYVPDQNNPYAWNANLPVVGRGPFTIYAEQVQNGSVTQGPISLAEVTIGYWNYGTTSTSGPSQTVGTCT